MQFIQMAALLLYAQQMNGAPQHSCHKHYSLAHKKYYVLKNYIIHILKIS